MRLPARTVSSRSWRLAGCGLALAASLSAVGCQVDVGGQTLPSAYWHQDDVQYFAPGPEMKVAREAAAQAAYTAEQQRAARQSDPGAVRR